MGGIIRSIFIVLAAVAIVGVGTYSFFSTTDTASGNTITAGTLAIDLLNQNTSNPLLFNIPNVLPGQEVSVNFDVKNDSVASGVQLRGAAFGAWDNVSGGDNTLFKVTKVERWNGAAWVTLASNPGGITGIFYDSADGTDDEANDGGADALFTVPAGGKDQFQLTVKFDESAGDVYQGEQYNAAIKVQARQNGATTWPVDLNTGF